MKNNKTVSLSLRKLLLSVLVTAPLATLPVPLWALPTSQANLDAQINSASGATATWNSATSVTVNSTTTNAIVRWNNFGAPGMPISSGDTITYNMPSSSSAVLNSVVGTTSTTINGALTAGANGGSIFVVNPNGIVVGSTGTITATNIGLSTVPEAEFTFAGTGKLSLTENQPPAVTTNGVLINGGTLTAASGTGNIWIAGKGVGASGTLDGGNVTIVALQNGDVTLAPAAGVNVNIGGVATPTTAGDLTIGDLSTKNSTLSVTTSGTGAITIDANHNLTVNGPSASLTTANGTITQASGTGIFLIGAGSPSNATLTTSSGTGATSLDDVEVAGNGLLTVNATGGALTINAAAGKLAVKGVGTSLTTTASAGDLTILAGNVSGALNATATNGDILAGGSMVVGGAANYTVTTSGKSITAHLASAPASLSLTLNATPGNVSVTQDAGNLTTPSAGLTAQNISFTAGNVTTGGTLSADATSGTVSLTATAGNVSIGHGMGAKNVTLWGSNSVTATGGSIDAPGAISITGSTGNVDTTNLVIGGSSAPATLNLTAGKAVTIGAAATATKIVASAGTTLSQGAAVNSTGTTGSVSYTSGGDLTTTTTIGATAAPLTVSLTSTSGNISVGAGITTQAAGTVTATAGGFVTNTSTINSSSTGNISLTANGSGLAGNVTTGTLTSGNITLTAGGDVAINNTQTVTKSFWAQGATVTQTAAITPTIADVVGVTLKSTSGDVSIGGTIGAGTAAGNVSVTSAGKIAMSQAVTAGTNGSVTMSAAGNVALTAALTAPTVSLTGAPITESGGGVILGGGALTLNSSGNITLNNASNNFASVVVVGAPNDALIDDTGAASVTLATGTNTSGNVTLNAKVIVLGAAAGDTISVAKALSLTSSAGTITDLSDNVTVSGALNLKSTGGGIVLDGKAGTTVGLNSSYGQVNISGAGGAVTVYENTTLNLGTLTLGANTLTAYSKTSIINTGVISGSGAILVGAGTASAPGTINLDYVNGTTTNAITGSIGLLTNLSFFSAGGLGNYLASKITVVNGANSATNLFSLTGTTDVGVQAVDVDLTAMGATTQLTVGAIATTGSLSLTAGAGGIANQATTKTTVSAMNVKSAGAVTLVNTKGFTLNGNVSGTAAAAYTADAGDLVIGNYVGSQTGAGGTTSFTASTGSVTDSVTGISIYGPVLFSGKSVAITKAGHSFGPVSVTATAGNASVLESGYLNLNAVSVSGGDFSAASTNGGVVQSGTITAGNVTVSAPQGPVLLTGANTISGWVSTTAGGNTTINNTGAVTLANLTSAGNLSVAAGGAGSITQASGTSIYAYGASSFVTSGAGAITVNNSGNQFGAITLTTGSGAVKIKEATTMNLKAVTTSGTFSATSEGGDILASGTTSGSITAGTSTFSAANGSILLNKADVAIPSASFTAGGNVAINRTAAALDLGASTIGGDLTVHGNTTAITQSGALNIAGNVTLWSGTITLLDNTNQFGPVQLHNTGLASISESGTFNLRSGTVSTGQVVINTGGDFVTSGVGGSSFTGGAATNATTAGLIINAPNGTITFGAGSVVVTTGLTVNASGTKDLSQLSKSGNLNGIDPFNQGTGTLIPPSTP